MTETEVGRLLREAAAKQRGYADFWDWPDKTTKEWQITHTFVQELNERLLDKIVRATQHPAGENFAPDVEVVTSTGQRWALELTELVSQKAIEATRRGKSFFATWSDKTIVSALKERVLAKDKPALFKGGPYDQFVLLLHTDEDMLSAERLRDCVSNLTLETDLIDQIYILVSYDPRCSGYPLLSVDILKRR